MMHPQSLSPSASLPPKLPANIDGNPLQIVLVCDGISARPVERTHICTGATTFFSAVTHSATMRFTFSSPSDVIFRSHPQLLVARRASEPQQVSSVNLGKKAASVFAGIQISKKLVRFIGFALVATGTSAHTVNLVSWLQLSHNIRSMYTMILPLMLTFCVPKTGTPELSPQHPLSA